VNAGDFYLNAGIFCVNAEVLRMNAGGVFQNVWVFLYERGGKSWEEQARVFCKAGTIVSAPHQAYRVFNSIRL